MITKEEIIKVIDSEEEISKDKILCWMGEEDLRIRGVLSVLTYEAWSRIKPELTMQEQCSFMQKYLMDCLEKNPKSGEYLLSGFEAGRELAKWVKHLNAKENTKVVLKEVACNLESLYKKTNNETRNRIITGALEHIFENKNLIKLFEKWQYDPVLKEAFQQAWEWGKDHQK